jgi:hypothetical protein
MEFLDGCTEHQKDWIISSLSNLRHIILTSAEICSVDNELARISNERIQRLDIYENYQFKRLIEISYVYFSNVQHICIYSFI